MITTLKIITPLDSTILSKVETLQKSFDKLQDKLTFSPWIPFITAVVGACFVLVGQWIERRNRITQELKKDIIETFNHAELILLQLKSLCKKLSSERNLMAYYYYQFEAEKQKHLATIKL